MSLSLSAFFLLFATADRWASSSTQLHVRSYCKISFARRLILGTTFIGCLVYVQVFYCYVAISDQFPVFCFCPTLICRMYNDFIFLILYSIIPPIFMLIFSWLTVKNVEKTRRQINISTTTNQFQNNLMKKRDRQMITMLVIQVLSFSLCVLPSGISKAFSTLTFNQTKDVLRITKENFSFQVKLNVHPHYQHQMVSFFLLGHRSHVVHELFMCVLHLYTNL